jgi:hypothetical protein
MEQTAFSTEPSVRKLFNHGLTRRKAAGRSHNQTETPSTQRRTETQTEKVKNAFKKKMKPFT